MSPIVSPKSHHWDTTGYERKQQRVIVVIISVKWRGFVLKRYRFDNCDLCKRLRKNIAASNGRLVHNMAGKLFADIFSIRIFTKYFLQLNVESVIVCLRGGHL